MHFWCQTNCFSPFLLSFPLFFPFSPHQDRFDRRETEACFISLRGGREREKGVQFNHRFLLALSASCVRKTRVIMIIITEVEFNGDLIAISESVSGDDGGCKKREKSFGKRGVGGRKERTLEERKLPSSSSSCSIYQFNHFESGWCAQIAALMTTSYFISSRTLSSFIFFFFLD